jgi:O-methyltransferase
MPHCQEVLTRRTGAHEAMLGIMSMLDNIRSAIQGVAGRLGYRIVRLPRPHAASPAGGLSYEPITPLATYAPWNSDELFLATYHEVSKHTLVDFYRCWELWTLVGQSAKLEGSILEVGVWRGGTGALMAKKAALCGIDYPVYLCDTFRGVVKAGANDTCYEGGEHADTSRRDVEHLVVERLKLDNVRILEGVFPDETARWIEDRHACFRLCHIDVDVYQSAKDIMDWIWGRMAVGGIVVFDDFGFQGCQGITRLVNEQSAERDRLVLHNLNGHALMLKLSRP